MKAKLLVISLFIALQATAAHANDAYIKVDATGKAIGGAIVCSADVCGDPNSVYSKLTLEPGERYVLQFKGDPVTGNVAGIPATQPNTQIQVDLQTNNWTKTTTTTLPEPTVVTIAEKPVTITGIQTSETWNPYVEDQQIPKPVVAKPTPTPTPTPTATPVVEETSATEDTTETTSNTFDWSVFDWSNLFIWLEQLMAMLANWNWE